jgi:hypothetical protein
MCCAASDYGVICASEQNVIVEDEVRNCTQQLSPSKHSSYQRHACPHTATSHAANCTSLHFVLSPGIITHKRWSQICTAKHGIFMHWRHTRTALLAAYALGLQLRFIAALIHTLTAAHMPAAAAAAAAAGV